MVAGYMPQTGRLCPARWQRARRIWKLGDLHTQTRLSSQKAEQLRLFD